MNDQKLEKQQVVEKKVRIFYEDYSFPGYEEFGTAGDVLK